MGRWHRRNKALVGVISIAMKSSDRFFGEKFKLAFVKYSKIVT